MMTRILITALLLLGLTGGFMFGDAFAQSGDRERDNERSGASAINQYDKKYKPAFVREQNKGQPPALLPSHQFHWKATKLGKQGDTKLHMAIVAPYPVHGCAEFVPPTAEVSYDEGARMVLVAMTPAVVKAPQKPRYGHFDCQGAPASIETPFTLDLQKIKEAGINRLVLTMESARTTFPLTLDEHAFRIAPEASGNTARGSEFGFVGNFTHWFFPHNALVLFTADARLSGSDLMADLNQFAHRHGMEPAESHIPGFESNRDLKIQNMPYYKTQLVLVDERGDLIKDLNQDRPEIVGNLQVQDGPRSRTIDIFAMKL